MEGIDRRGKLRPRALVEVGAIVPGKAQGRVGQLEILWSGQEALGSPEDN